MVKEFQAKAWMRACSACPNLRVAGNVEEGVRCPGSDVVAGGRGSSRLRRGCEDARLSRRWANRTAPWARPQPLPPRFDGGRERTSPHPTRRTPEHVPYSKGRAIQSEWECCCRKRLRSRR